MKEKKLIKSDVFISCPYCGQEYMLTADKPFMPHLEWEGESPCNHIKEVLPAGEYWEVSFHRKQKGKGRR
jgi:hypothetical protein